MKTSWFVFGVEFYCFPITKITEHYLTDSGFERNWFESNYLISLQIISSLDIFSGNLKIKLKYMKSI